MGNGVGGLEVGFIGLCIYYFLLLDFFCDVILEGR